ncbi:PA14 domain-containing protein [Phormidesmis sp. 146-33]
MSDLNLGIQTDSRSVSLQTNPAGASSIATTPNALFPEDRVAAVSSSSTLGMIGVSAEYFDDDNFTDSKLVRTDRTIDFDWGSGSPSPQIASDSFSVRWSGQIQPTESATYTFYTQSDDSVRLWVNGQLLIDHWQGHAVAEDRGTIDLSAGQKYALKMEYREAGGNAVAKLLWSSPTQPKQVIPESQFSISGRAIAASQSPSEMAKSADSFIDSVGIVTHLRYTDTSYARFGDVVEPRLRELGIRHVRDGGNDAGMFDKLNRLAQFGIRSTLVMDARDGVTPDNAVELLKKVTSSVIAVEGPNEWDVNTGLTYKGKSFPDGVRDYQTDLYKVIKGNAATSHLPVIAPSLAIPEYGSRLGSLKSVVDMGNMHSYAGGNLPAQDLDWRWISHTKQVSEDEPIVVTETGWHNAINDTQASQKGVSEQVAAKYVPRLFLEYFNRGIQRTFLYELMDERPQPDQENNFGLIRSDGTPKPAFYSLKNLMSLLNDAQGSKASGGLNYSLAGNTQNVRHTLLQKSSGEFYLVLWSDVVSADTAVNQSVTLNLSSPIKQATTYLTNQSIDPTATYSTPTQLALNVPDSPLVVKLTPS